jgi:hypothetical protein
MRMCTVGITMERRACTVGKKEWRAYIVGKAKE